MRAMKKTLFRLGAALGLVAGCALLVCVVRRSGASLDFATLARHWPLALAVTVWFTLPLLAASQSWRLLFPNHGRPPAASALCLTWIGFGVNWLLPVAAIGGEVVKFRLGLIAGWPGTRLAASLVADKTLQVATQILYLLIGAGLLLTLTGKLDWELSGVIWLAGFAACVAVFFRAQRTGMFSGMARALTGISGGRLGPGAGTRRVDAAIRRVYSRRGALLNATLLRMAFRVLMAGEIIMVLWWLGPKDSTLPMLLASAIVLESLAQGARAMAFFIPAGLGAQEGALIGAGMLLGLPAEGLLLIALFKRTREVLAGGAGLLLWQWMEARRLAPAPDRP